MFSSLRNLSDSPNLLDNPGKHKVSDVNKKSRLTY
jgi:hypothetical protein